MQISWLPSSVCDKTNKIARDFIWKGNSDKGLHLVGWEKITYQKNMVALECGLLEMLVWICNSISQSYGLICYPINILGMINFWIASRKVVLLFEILLLRPRIFLERDIILKLGMRILSFGILLGSLMDLYLIM